MKNTIDLTIGNISYKGIPAEVARSIERALEPYKATTTTKSKESTPKAETKSYAKAYAVSEDGKSVTVGNDGFIPTKVFKGITYSLKTAGAKYDGKTKAWTFGTKKACTDWCKAQDARA